MILTSSLKKEYQRLFTNLIFNNAGIEKQCEVKAKFLESLFPRYYNISLATGVEPLFIALLHHMECGNDFTKHLHNGDPLTSRTKQVPAGRPIEDPFTSKGYTFEESAIDCLEYEKFDQNPPVKIEEILFQCEDFNGWGYRKFHPTVLSPYLWVGSKHYTRGKYVGDGKYDSKAVSKQLGIALILKKLME